MQFMLRTLGLIRSENIPKQNNLFLLQKQTPPEIDTITSPPTIISTPPPPPSIQTISDHLMFAMVRILAIYESSSLCIKQSDSK
jgi:hypothetical protein